MVRMKAIYWAASLSLANTCTRRSGIFSSSALFGISSVSAFCVSRTRIVQDARRFMASATDIDSKSSSIKSPPPKVPITLLSGFLGTGKTTTLQHLLENNQGVKVGVIVNDVASVNIDAKLVSGSQNGVVELQNGCACCSLADELLTSVEKILDGGARDLDAVIVELSGVADPIAIKSNWKAAKLQGLPVTEKADVSQIVTVVDASTFGTDFMTWDVAGQRDGWVDPADDCAAQRKVPELLAEQVEAADVLIINKIDLAGEEQVKVASELARTLNEKARLETVSFGKASTKEILKKLVPMEESSIEVAAHGHDHDHSSSCEDPTCTDPSHSHSHSHSHENEAGACSDPDCTDTSHSHSHDHGSDVSACTDPDCTDTSHTHTHSHSHSTSTDNLGIVNFVYKSDRPFNTMKLLTLLNKWPVPIKDDLDLSLLKEAQKEGYSIQGQEENSPFVGVLRSKGFCWFAPTKWSGQGEDVWRHDTAMYWSHAGKHFGISSAGKWWGTIGKEQMKKYFKDNMDEYNRIVKEDFVSEEFGDRRQEIVFIGVNLDEEEITHALDNCLLTEKGLERYRQELKNFEMTVLTSPGAEPSLFDVGGTDHLDDEQ